MEKIGEIKPDNLIAGQMYRSTAQVILSSGKIYPVGAVISLKSDGKGALVDSSSADAKTVYGILAEEVDATSQDIGGIVYLSGEFNQNILVFGGADTFDAHKNSARELGIFFLDSDPYISE